ncbi:hypothetical protein [Methanobrevibacter sp.]|nr:hypothetical protein [Methanobrevibacter sp.]MDO5823393.1 hypothetical protein [Methanobrevibacter sp.]
MSLFKLIFESQMGDVNVKKVSCDEVHNFVLLLSACEHAYA